MPLEDVWSALPEGRWETVDAVARASGLARDIVNRCISFLVRWNFAETEAHPDFHVRRKKGVISPLLVLQSLRSLAGIETAQSNSKSKGLIAERIACSFCGNRNLRPAGANEVECSKCSKRQWRSIRASRLD